MSGNALLQFARILVDKGQQDMVAAHTLAHMPNAWTFPLHPGVDRSLKRSHTVTTLSAIKAFKPIHQVILSASKRTSVLHHATSITIKIERYCNISSRNLPEFRRRIPCDPRSRMPQDSKRLYSTLRRETPRCCNSAKKWG